LTPSVSLPLHELDSPPWRRVESTLMATSRALRRAYDLRLAGLDLNLSEANLLAFVAEHGPMTQTQVAERIGMGRASAGQLIDALRQRSLLERRPDPDDRRAWLVALTPRAQPLVERVRVIDRRLRDELREGIDRSERRQLARTLLRLQANLEVVLEEERRNGD